MAQLNASQLVKEMLAAAATVLRGKAPEILDYAKVEMRKIAETLVLIERLQLRGQVTAEQASVLFDMQKNASRSVLYTLEGLSAIVAEQAINAALAVVKATVNRVLGIALL